MKDTLRSRTLLCNVEIGARIKRLRILNGMSMQKLGNAMGSTWQQVHKYEQGRDAITAAGLCLVSDILNTSPATFFPKEEATEAPKINTRFLTILMHVASGIKSQKDYKTLIELATLLSEKE